jgi:transposase
MTTRQFSYALKSKLPGGLCLIIIGTEGDFTHKLSRTLVGQYSHIAVEDPNIAGLARGMLAKSVLNAAWG